MLHQHTSIGCEATASTSNMSVNFKDLFNAAGHHQRRGDALLHSQQDTINSLDADGSRAKLE